MAPTSNTICRYNQRGQICSADASCEGMNYAYEQWRGPSLAESACYRAGLRIFGTLSSSITVPLHGHPQQAWLYSHESSRG